MGGNIALTNTNSPLTITGITTTNGGNITINNVGDLTTTSAISTTANGAINLTASGIETISGAINTNGTGAVTLSGGNGIQLGANITTSGGNINFAQAVMLTSNPVINAATGNITFQSTLDGNFTPTLSSSGTLTFNGVIGGIVPLASLTTTLNSPGVTDINNNITTAGAQTYGNPILLGGNSTFLANGNNTITINGGVTWTGAYSLGLNAQNIAINGPMNGINGSLNLTAAAPPTPSITTGANGSINVGSFNLLQGYWYQSGTLPAFSATNFELNSGTIPANNVEFFRVAGGAGTTGNPYLITDVYGLQGIDSNTALLNQDYKLNNSFDASNTANWYSGAGFIPIGTSANPFTGTLNGQNNSVTGLTINSALASNIGLFGYTSNAAVITNINLLNANINSTLANATNVGSLVGKNNGAITGSYATGTVTTTGNNATNIGGLVGDNFGSIASDTVVTYSLVNVSANGTNSSDVGGLVGTNEGANGIVQTSYAGGNVTAGTGSSNIGGLVGFENSTNANPIQNTYAIGTLSVTNGTDVGGLVGNQSNTSGPITTSYSSGIVPTSGTNIGGFIGDAGVTTNANNFFDMASSGTTTGVGAGSANGVSAESTANMQTFNTYNSAGWNISDTPSTGSTPPTATWYMLNGQTRPLLATEWSTTVTNTHQLQLMDFAQGASYSLANSINASNITNLADVWGTTSGNGAGFIPVGNTTNNFTGNFNGNNNTTSNLYINSTSLTGTGLFGATGSASTIANVAVTSANVTNLAANATDIGILVGQNNGTLNHVNTSGSIQSGAGSSNVGGLVGQNNGSVISPTNTFSFSTANIQSSGNNSSNIGGLIGQSTSNGTVSNAYYSGTISASGNNDSNLGGLIGDNQGSVSTVYSSGALNVTGTSPTNLGGLVGTNEGANGALYIAYSTTAISVANALGANTGTNVGGLVGFENSTNASAILDTYATGSITFAANNTGTNVGGLVGNEASGAIEDSYSIGKTTGNTTAGTLGGLIGVIEGTITNANNFFDTTTSGTMTGVGSGSTSGVTGDPTATMQMFNTFNNAGWNFSTPIWGIFDGYSYPYFASLELGVQVIDAVSGGVTPTAATNGNTIAPVQVANSGSNYYYLFNQSQLTAGNPIIFYNTAGTVGNGLVIIPTTAYITPVTLTILGNTIQVGGSNNASISASNFGSASGAGADLLYSVSGGNLTLGNSTNPNVTLLTNTNTGLTFDTAVNSIAGGTDLMTLNGAVTINNGNAAINTSGTQTYNGAVTLLSAANLTNTGGDIIVNGNVADDGNNLTVNNVGSNSSINGVLSGSGGLNKLGLGTLTLANNNSYLGNTTLTNGTLALNAPGATPTPLGAGSLILSGGTLTAGSLLTGPVNNAYTNSGIATISTIGGSNNLTLSGPGTLNSGYILNVNNTATTTLTGNLSGSGALNELGGTLVMGNASTNNSAYSGNINISNNGSLQLGVATNALGTGNVALNNGNLQSNIATATITNPLTVNGASSITGNNNINIAGPTTLYSGMLTVNNTSTTTLSGSLQAGAGGLTENAAGGTLIVSGANNSAYLGATTLTNGVLDIATQTNALGTGTGNSLIFNGGTLASTYSSGTASLVNKFLVSNSSIITGTNSLTLTGNGTLNNALNVTNTAGAVTLSGNINGSNGSIVQNGAGGTLAISGTNGYGTAGSTGTTITAGTLIAESSKALGVGNVVVNSGGELALNGLGAGSLSVANPLFLAGSGVSNAGALVDVDTSGEGNTASGLITLNANSTIGVINAGETLSLTGGITNNGFTTTFTPATTTSNIISSGVISGTGGLNMNGVGVLQLPATNVFSGNNTVNSGTVIASNNQSLGVNNNTTVIGTVEVAGANLVSSEAFTLNNGILEGTKTTAQPSAAGNITLAPNSSNTIKTLAAADNFTLSGTINGTSGGSNNGDLTLAGPGTMTLSGIVGGTTAIDSLTDNSTLALNANAVTSVGNQTYNSGVTLSAATTTLKTTGTGVITIGGTMAVGAHNLNLTSASSITESGAGKITNTGTNTITTSSTSGTFLTGANTISMFNGTDTSTSGIALVDTAAPLTITGITQTGGGNISVNNTGAITSTGAISTAANGNIGLTASGTETLGGAITAGGSGVLTLTTTGASSDVLLNANASSTSGNININAGRNITIATGKTINTPANVGLTAAGVISETGTGAITNATLTTSSKGGTTLTGANTITNFTATNITSGNIALTNTVAALNVNGITQSGTGASVTVTNTGAMNINTNPISGGTSTITLSATGALAINQGVSDTNKAIALTGAGITVAASKTIGAGTGNITVNASGAGNTLTLNSGSSLSSTGLVSLSADNMTFDTSATPSQIGGTNAQVILEPTTSGRSIGIAGASGSLQLSTAALNDITAKNVQIGNSTAGTIAINAWTPAANFASNGVLTLDTASTITQGGTIDLLTNSNASLLLRGASSVDLATNSGSGNNIGSVAATGVTGALLLNVNHALTVSSLTDSIGTANGISTTGAVTLTANNNALTLNAPISASASGTAITLAGDMFTNNAGATALNPGSGRFLVYSVNPANDNRGSLAYNFKQYNIAYPTAPAQSTGNGFLYTIAPVLTPELVLPAVEKVYDGTTAATLVPANYSETGSIDGDTVTFNNPTSGTYAQAAAGTNINVAVTGINVASTTNGSATVYGYQLASTTANANIGIITSAALTVANFLANNKVYDATTSATISSFGSLTGVIGSDNVTLDTTNAIANFITKNVGTNITVNGSGYVLQGSDANNYTLIQPSTTANITPASLTANGVTANNKVYDSTTNATLNTSGATLSGVLGTDNVSINATGNTGIFATPNVGNGIAVTATNISLGGTDAGNYIVNPLPTSLTANITPATLIYNANTASRLYGATNPTFNGSVTGFVGSDNLSNATTGTLLFTSPALVTSNVGNYAINGSGLTANNGNYIFTQALTNATALTISPATLTYNATAANRLYGATNPTLTGTVTGFVNSDTMMNATTGTLSFTSPALATSNVGNYAINGSGLTANNGNYIFTQALANATALTISPATLTYNATAASRLYGAANPTLTGTVTGFVNSDTMMNATTGTLSFTSPALATSNVGNYAINGSGLAANNGNYIFTQALSNTTALTITPATLTYNADAVSRLYGAANPTFTGTVTGFVNSDTMMNATTGTLSFTSLALATSNVGSYAINGSGLTANNGNYIFAQALPNATALTINPATLTYNSTAASRLYGDVNPTFTGTVTGFVNSDTMMNATTGTLSFTSPALATSNVGSYAINGTGLTANNGNYIFAEATGNAGALTINPATLTYTADAANRLYGAANPTFSGTITGFVNSDTMMNATTGTLSFTSPALATSNVGNYAINGSGLTANNGNYIFTQALPNATALTINPATLTYTADAASRAYGAANPTFMGTVTGFVNSDTITNATSGTLNFSSPADVTSNVGSYTINGSGLTANNGNYVFSQGGTNATALTITAASLTVTANSMSKVYGMNDPLFTYNETGLVNGDTLSGSLTRTITQADENVGAYQILQGSLAASSNYALTYVSNNLTITPATLTINANAASKTYGVNDPNFTYNQTGLVNGVFVDGIAINDTITGTLSRSLMSSSDEDVGQHDILQGSVTASNNYNVIYNGNTLTINPATLTVNANVATKTYGTNDPNFTYTQTGLVNGTVDNIMINDTISGALARTLVSTSDEDVGNHTILQGTLTAGNNYNLVYNNNNLTITPATLTINANAASKTYGVNDPNFTYNQTGLVNGVFVDGIAINDTISGTLSRSLLSSSAENVGQHDILQGSVTASNNYNVIYNGNTLTINPATLTVTANPQTKVYGTPDPALTYAQTGLVDGMVDGILIDDMISGAQTRTAGTNVGSYAIQQGSLSASNNYNFSYTGSNLSITPATLTVSLTGTISKTYDTTTTATLTAANYLLSGIVGTDMIVLNDPTIGNYNNEHAGVDKPVTVNGLSISGAAASNYQLASNSVVTNVGTILPATLTVTGVSANNKTYNGSTAATLNTQSAVLTGIFAGDQVNLNNSSYQANFISANPGFHIPVTVANLGLNGLQASDYTLVQPTGLSATIFAAANSNNNNNNMNINRNISGQFNNLFGIIFPTFFETGIDPLLPNYSYDNVFYNTGVNCAKIDHEIEICPKRWDTIDFSTELKTISFK